jgi:hypothetical protein
MKEDLSFSSYGVNVKVRFSYGPLKGRFAAMGHVQRLAIPRMGHTLAAVLQPLHPTTPAAPTSVLRIAATAVRERGRLGERLRAKRGGGGRDR